MYFDKKESNYFLNLLKTAKEQASIESYIYIKNVLNTIDFTIPFTIYPKGAKFFRCRVNGNEDTFFYDVKDLSYRLDVQNIKNFGRSNEPGQSVFYCSDNDLLAFAETSQLARDENDEKPLEYHTIGEWISTKEIIVANLLTNEDIRGQHKELDYLSQDFENIVKTQADETAEALYQLIQFLSKEFSTPALGNSNHYNITAAFTNYIFNSVSNADGVIYPSTQHKSEGFNLALKPEIVDAKLKFHCAYRIKMELVGEKKYADTECLQSLISDGSHKINW